MNEVDQIDQEIAKLKKQLDQVQGTQTEVYTRIVGYYRSVANWNKGKREEYDHRKLFSEPEDMIIRGSTEITTGKKAVEGREADGRAEKPVPIQGHKVIGGNPVALSDGTIHYMFFHRKTCPNCPPVREFLAGLDIAGHAVDVDTPEGTEEALRHNVLSAPSVIFFDVQGKELVRAHNVETLHEIIAPLSIEV
jgi:ribonucleoside-triphosphate reductase